jgi:hypothetical protein
MVSKQAWRGVFVATVQLCCSWCECCVELHTDEGNQGQNTRYQPPPATTPPRPNRSSKLQWFACGSTRHCGQRGGSHPLWFKRAGECTWRRAVPVRGPCAALVRDGRPDGRRRRLPYRPTNWAIHNHLSMHKAFDPTTLNCVRCIAGLRCCTAVECCDSAHAEGTWTAGTAWLPPCEASPAQSNHCSGSPRIYLYVPAVAIQNPASIWPRL